MWGVLEYFKEKLKNFKHLKLIYVFFKILILKRFHTLPTDLANWHLCWITLKFKREKNAHWVSLSCQVTTCVWTLLLYHFTLFLPATATMEFDKRKRNILTRLFHFENFYWWNVTELLELFFMWIHVKAKVFKCVWENG